MSMAKVYARARGIPVELVEQVWDDIPESCDCYECVGPEYNENDEIINNFMWHTLYQPCEHCDGYRTALLDLGRKGYFVCPNDHK